MADNVPTMFLPEADCLRTTDYFFDRIGDPVPIKPSPFNFDRQNPPSQPLAVSEIHGLIFVAHDSGFCVVRRLCMPYGERQRWMYDYEEWQRYQMNDYEEWQHRMNDILHDMPYEERRQRWMNDYEERRQRRMNDYEERRQRRMKKISHDLPYEERQRWMNNCEERRQQRWMNDYEDRQRRMNDILHDMPCEERQRWMDDYEERQRWMDDYEEGWQRWMDDYEEGRQRRMNTYEERQRRTNLYEERQRGMNEDEERQRQFEMQFRTSSVFERRYQYDVPLGEVRILALSFDNSYLAASVGGDVHLFKVDEPVLNQYFSRSLIESSNVKDIRWRTKSDNSFLVLSELGKLYHGKEDGYFKMVMGNVDAVEWSIEGDYIVVAKENNLSILSSKFKDRSRMLLPFNSWIGDTDANRTVKVDSIRWVRRDSIIVGCFQLTEDGREKDYLVQVIRSEEGKLSDASCKPIVISCPNLCSSINDNILPFGRGPYLLASYLEECELALIANKKNTDQYFSYLGWSRGEKNDEFAVIEIERETRLPRIELQENGDENLILGMCTVKLRSPDCFVSFGELTEQCCILMCLTVEGKLVTFDVRRRVRDG